MLLEVTPSLLESLGIGEGSIVSHGSASYAPSRGAQHPARTLKVVRLKKQMSTSGSGATLLASPSDEAEVQEHPLSAQAMAERMQCSRNNVYDQESRGRLFSVVPPGRQNGRAFPAFQLAPTLDRELLWSLIAAYTERKVPLNLLWDFLRSVHDEFGGLTGVQILTRKAGGRQAQTPRAAAVLSLPDAERRQFVKDVALEDLSHAFL